MNTAGVPVEKLQIGGARFQKQVLDWGKQSNSLFLTVFTVGLVIYALYADKLPEQVRWQLSTTIGRLLLLLVLGIVYSVAGWIPALLFTIGIAITWFNRPLYKPIENFESEEVKGNNEKDNKEEEVKEGFEGDMKTTKVETHKWFVEKVLQENPRKIVEDRVKTEAIHS